MQAVSRRTVTKPSRSLLYECAGWYGKTPNLALLNDLIRFGFDASEIEAPVFSRWPKHYRISCEDGDQFFIEWMAKNIQVSPGKLEHTM